MPSYSLYRTVGSTSTNSGRESGFGPARGLTWLEPAHAWSRARSRRRATWVRRHAAQERRVPPEIVDSSSVPLARILWRRGRGITPPDSSDGTRHQIRLDVWTGSVTTRSAGRGSLRLLAGEADEHLPRRRWERAESAVATALPPASLPSMETRTGALRCRPSASRSALRDGSLRRWVCCPGRDAS